eukprot:1877749-Rhodomonas_salina.1
MSWTSWTSWMSLMELAQPRGGRCAGCPALTTLRADPGAARQLGVELRRRVLLPMQTGYVARPLFLLSACSSAACSDAARWQGSCRCRRTRRSPR